MKLQEAIEINITLEHWFNPPLIAKEKEALRLGIEALKRVEAYKKFHVGVHYEPMPGETID